MDTIERAELKTVVKRAVEEMFIFNETVAGYESAKGESNLEEIATANLLVNKFGVNIDEIGSLQSGREVFEVLISSSEATLPSEEIKKRDYELYVSKLRGIADKFKIGYAELIRG